MLKWLFLALIGLHGILHGLGVAKAWHLAELPALVQPISRGAGYLWLVAGLLVLSAALALAVGSPSFWVVCGLAAVLSQVAIMTSFGDAKWGTLANVLLIVVSVSGFMMYGPYSFRAQFERDRAEGRARLAALSPAPEVKESDLEKLPAPVKTYLQKAGFVGQPEVRGYDLEFRMRLRGGPSEPWIHGTVEQASFADRPTRLFLLSATMFGLPVQAFHRYVDGHATFQVKLAGLISITHARGPELDRTETVTLLNDMFMLAPGTLLSPELSWESMDKQRVRVTYTHRQNQVSAELLFDAEGMAADFVSDDRQRSVQNGKAFVKQRFTTPVRAIANFGKYRLPSVGEAHWHAPPPEGDFVYGEYELEKVAFR
jgi:hypothetical protein